VNNTVDELGRSHRGLVTSPFFELFHLLGDGNLGNTLVSVKDGKQFALLHAPPWMISWSVVGTLDVVI